MIDTNGDGRITKPWNVPASAAGPAAFDPKLDTLTTMGSYGMVPDSKNKHVVWFAWQPFPGRIARLDVGDNPPETCITEVYEVPSTLDPKVPHDKTGFSGRGARMSTATGSPGPRSRGAATSPGSIAASARS